MGRDLVYKNGACVQANGINICIVYISLSIIGRLVGVLPGRFGVPASFGWVAQCHSGPLLWPCVPFEDVSGGRCRYTVVEEGFVCGAGM